MTDYPVDVNVYWTAIEPAMPTFGKTTGRRVPPPGTKSMQYNVGALSPILIEGGDYEYVAGGASPVGTSDHDARRVDQISMGGEYWFEAVHLMPRGGVDFGNIITDTDERFELFSAFRHDDVTLLNVTNNALPGTELPDLPAAPTTLAHMNSFLDPASTNLNPIQQIVRALTNGLPNFDTTIDFQFDSGAGTLYLGVIGNRIALLTMQFDSPVRETLQWKTDVLSHKDGSEQRVSSRKNPRQLFDAPLKLTEEERQRFKAFMFGWQGMTIASPAWTEQMTITQDVTGGAGDTVQVDSTDYVDVRVGGLAVVFTNATAFEVLTVSSVTSTSVTFDQDVANNYSAGDLVVPIRLTVLADERLSGSRRPVNLEEARLKLLVTENDTGAPTGDTSAFSAYGGKVLLDDCNFVSGQMSQALEQRLTVTDGLTGILSQQTPWSKNKRAHVKGFVVKTRQALWNVRRLLYALRGRQVSFRIPTFTEDLTVTQSLVSGTDTMDVSWVGYSRFIQDREHKATFKITFTDGTSLIREVQSSIELSATEERLTLDATWPSNKTADQVQRVEFYELVRLDTDEVTIEHGAHIGAAKIFFPVKVVFD